MNKTVLITGANSGIGKEAARQLALKPETEKIYLACRTNEKANQAKLDLEVLTATEKFIPLVLDVSKSSSVRSAVETLEEPIDALIMNAGGMGALEAQKKTEDGVTTIFAANVLGHAILLDELLKRNLLKNVALFAGSEASRGVKKLNIPAPKVNNASADEFIDLFTGKLFSDDHDVMDIYGNIKYAGTLWISAMARKYPSIKFITMSPGSTQGTEAMNNLPTIKKLMFKYVMMPVLLPMLGMAHSLETGTKRFVDGISDDKYKSGVFYASKDGMLTGEVVDQSEIFTDLKNTQIQDNAAYAVNKFVKESVLAY